MFWAPKWYEPQTVLVCSEKWLVLICVVQEEPDRAPSTLKPEGIVTLTELRLNYFPESIKLTWF